VLFNQNPYFYKGSKGEGIGGSHCSNYIWLISIIMCGLTSTNKTEVEECMRIVPENAGETYFIQELYNKDNDQNYTFSLFA
jgi:meiotically up-regulated gene 157 (Mug157) protein